MSVVDALSQETRYEYDSRNRLVATINADGTGSQSRYDFDNNLIGNIDGNGNRTTSLYDARNRLIRSIDALGNVTQYTYDVVNQLIAVTDSEGNQTRYEYDELGRQITIIDALGNETRTEYDKVGNVMAEIDALGNRIEYEYDAQNRVISVTDPNNGETITAYDKVGNVVAIIDPVGNRTSYTYDARNRLLTETNQLGATRSYKYDAVGNQIEVTDRNNRVRSFTYDALNRPKEEIWLDEEGNPIRTITSTYDSGSQLTKISDSDSTYTLTYDLRGRLIAMDNAGTPGVPNVVLNYSYDSEGNLLELTDSLGGITTYTYDELNRVSQIAQNGSGVSEKRVDFSYNTLGQYEAINRYSDLDGTNLVIGTTYVYDELNRLSSLTHSNGLSKNVAFYNFAYDAASRITQITDIDGITNYNYDERNQLIGADRSDENNPDESYSYDANGNRISSHLHSNYTTGDNNRLESDGVYNYEYDGEGNLIRETEIATGNVREYEWDWRNRLISVVDSGEVTQSVSYTYDVFNRRIAKTVNGVVTYFVHDSLDALSNVVLEFVDEDGVAGVAEPVLTQRYLHGPGVDQVLAQEDENGTLLWHLGDQLGTIRDLANSSGEVVNHYTYNSYGNLIAQTDDEVENRYLYTGREFDSETGLHYYRARYYDGATGRFIGLDPIGFDAGDTNLYRYVENDPINWWDPTGDFKVELRYRPRGQRFHADIIVTHSYRDPKNPKNNPLRQWVYWAGPQNLVFQGGPRGIVGGFVLGEAGIILSQNAEFTEGTEFTEGYQYFNNLAPGHSTVIYDDGTDCPNKILEQEIENALQLVQDLRIPYHPLGPNSNTAARYALWRAGLINLSYSPPGRILPGWWHPVVINPGGFQRNVLQDLRRLGYPQ